MVAARCSGARKTRDFVNGHWRLSVQVIENYIRSLESFGGNHAENLFTLGNLYWMRFQLHDSPANSNDIDLSIKYLQSAVNVAPTNDLRHEAMINLGHSLCMRHDLSGSHADIDTAEEWLREAEAQPHDHHRSVFYLQRDLGYAMYKIL
jgi:tetratricopeptide (TPR) repeat protein